MSLVNLGPEERWDEAVTRMTARIARTLRSPLDGFPHYSDAETGEWLTTDDGFWTGGFWVGELWLAGHFTGDTVYSQAAESWLRKLSTRVRSKSVFRAFLFYYAAVLGDRLAASNYARQIAIRCAESLSNDFNSVAGLIPLGTEAEEAHKVGDHEANIDGLIASPLLLWAAAQNGNPDLRRVALAHADRSGEFCVQADGSVIQSASFDPQTGRLMRRYTHKGSSPSAIWTRAQAWAILGYSLSAMHAPDVGRLLVRADQVAQWWMANVPKDHIAYWDFSVEKRPDTKRDTSGTAIAAASLLRLSAIHPDRERAAVYRQFAQKTVEALVRRHLTPTRPDDRRPPGMLADGCFDPNNGTAIANELIWGDYFLFEALGSLSGRLGPAIL
jgi:unsaturated chondroitin disaccharide hydrolase